MAYGLRVDVLRHPETQIMGRNVDTTNGGVSGRFNTFTLTGEGVPQACRVMTQLVDELALPRRARVLNCMGIRAEESPARAKRQPFISNDPVYSNKTKRQVDTWLPIFDWTEDEVWSTIKASGVRHHFAYDLGMPRLSCCFCIFAPRPALLIAGEHNPELLAEYVRVERAINHKFRQTQTLVEIQTALASGERASGVTQWMQCS